jgi:hypothetical protein
MFFTQSGKILFILQSLRNIVGYLFLYEIVRPYLHLVQLEKWDEFVHIHLFVFMPLFFIGSFASWKIYKNRGKYLHFVYFKYEIAIDLIIIILLEALLFN